MNPDPNNPNQPTPEQPQVAPTSNPEPVTAPVAPTPTDATPATLSPDPQPTTTQETPATATPESPANPAAPVTPTEQPAQQVPTTPAVPPTVQGGAAPASEHSDTLGIISIILAFFMPLVGLIIGLIGRNKAKNEGYSTKLSKIGIIISSVFLVLGLLLAIIYVVFIGAVLTTSTSSLNEISDDSDTRLAVISLSSELAIIGANNTGKYPELLKTEDLEEVSSDVTSALVVLPSETSSVAAEAAASSSSATYVYVPFDCENEKCSGYVVGAPQASNADGTTGYYLSSEM